MCQRFWPFLCSVVHVADELWYAVQAAMMNWGGQKMSALDMFSSIMGFQALAGQQAGHLQAPALSPCPSAIPANSAGATFSCNRISQPILLSRQYSCTSLQVTLCVSTCALLQAESRVCCADLFGAAAGAGELLSAQSGMASFDAMPHAPGMVPWASADVGAGLADAAALPTAASGVLPRPGKPPGHLPAGVRAVAGADSVSVSGHAQQSQGFMPYKWRHHPLPRGVHQLQPGGLLSLGKRSASASLAEPARKRALSGNLP